MNLLDFKEANPAYKDTPDDQLANGLYEKFYKGKVERSDFDKQIGLTPIAPPEEPPTLTRIGRGAVAGVRLLPKIGKQWGETAVGTGEAVANLAGQVPDLTSGFKQIYVGLKQGAYSFYDFLDKSADLIATATGTKKGGIFGKLAQDVKPSDTESEPGIVQAINRALGAAPGAILPYVLPTKVLGPIAGMATTGAITASPEGLKEAAIGAAKGGLMGGSLHAISGLPMAARAPLMGGVMVAPEIAEGKPAEEIIPGFVTGVALGVPGRIGGIGVRRKKPPSPPPTIPKDPSDLLTQYGKEPEKPVPTPAPEVLIPPAATPPAGTPPPLVQELTKIPTEAEKVAPAPSGEVPKAKEPWEMTKEEFSTYKYQPLVGGEDLPEVREVKVILKDNGIPLEKLEVRGSRALGVETSKSDYDIYLQVPKEMARQVDDLVEPLSKRGIDVLVNQEGVGKEGGTIRGEKTHKRIVEKALSEGKPVPAEVLKDYPDLAPKPPVEPGKVGVPPTPAGPLKSTHTVTIEGVEYPAIITKNTIPGEGPWRVTWFDPKDNSPVSHIPMVSPELFPKSFINGFGQKTKIEITPIVEPGKVVGKKPAIPGVRKKEANTFVEWVRQEGGIWDEQLSGETRRLQGRESGIIGLVSKKGKSFDKLVQRAMEDGWLPEGSTERDVINLIEQDAIAAKQGKPRVVKAGEEKAPEMPKWEPTPEEQSVIDEQVKLEKEGFEITDRVAVGNLKPGDQVVIEGEKFIVKGMDENGLVTFEDGRTIKKDIFDVIRTDAVKIEPVEEKSFALKAIEEVKQKTKEGQTELLRRKEILKQIEKESPEEYAKILKGNTAELVKEWETKRLGKAKKMTQAGMFEEPKEQLELGAKKPSPVPGVRGKPAKATEIIPSRGEPEKTISQFTQEYKEGLGEGGFIRIGGVEKTPKVVVPGTKDVALPEFGLGTLHVADRHPDLAPIIKANIKAEQNTNNWILRNSDKISEAFDKVERPGLWMRVFGRKGTAIRDLDLMIEGKKPVPPQLTGFVTEIKGILGDIKGEVIKKMKNDFSDSLSPKQKEYLSWVQGGKVGDKPKYVRSGTIKAVDEALTQFKEMEKWGIQDYFPHIFKGKYKYLTEDRNIIASGQTAKQAKANFEEYVELHPETIGKTFMFVNDFYDLLTVRKVLNPELTNPLEYLGTRLSRKEFFRLLGKTEGVIKEEIANAGVADIPKVKVDMSGIASFQKGAKFSGHFLKRKTSLRGEEADPFKSLMSYVFSVGRKLGLEDAKMASYSFADSLPKNMPNAASYIKMQADNMAGRYNIIDKIYDETIGEKLGSKPFGVSRIFAKGVGLESKLKLGYAPAKTAINRIGGTFHTILQEGGKNYLEGKRLLRVKDPDLMSRIEKEGHLAGMEQLFAGEGLIGVSQKQISWWKPLGKYQKAEVKNRSEALAAAYNAGLKKFSGDKDAAWIYAIDSAILTQGLYNTAAKPVIVRGPIIQATYQFKQYLTNEIRFMSQFTPQQWAGYIPGMVALAGTRGALLTIKSIIGVSVIGLGIDELMERLNRKAPHLHRGIFGLVGIDVSAPASWQIPSSVKDWIGVFPRDIIATGEMIIKGMQNKGWTDEQINDYVKQIAPVGYNIFKGLQMLSEGVIKEGTKVIYRGGKEEGVINLAGAKSVSQSQASDSARYMNQQRQSFLEKSKVLEDKLFGSKSIEEANNTFKELAELKNIQTSKEMEDFVNGLKRSALSRQLTEEIRIFLTLPRALKKEIVEERIRNQPIPGVRR